MIKFTYKDCQSTCRKAAKLIKYCKKYNYYRNIYGVPGGGCVPAVMIANELDLPLVSNPTNPKETLIIDNIIDSDTILNRYIDEGYDTFCLIYKSKTSSHKPTYFVEDIQDQVVFDWESQ